MESAFIAFNQVAVMYSLMAVGYILAKKKMLSDEGTKQMTSLLLYIVAPCVIITAMQIEFDISKARGIGISFVFAVIVHLTGIVVARVFIGKKREERRLIERMSLVISNLGFMGIPLVMAILGSEGVFYVAAPMAVMILVMWTYCVVLLTGEKKSISGRQILKNPGIIATVLGIAVFVSPVKLPNVLNTAIGNIAALNTPLGMMVLGTYLSRVNIPDLLSNKRFYYLSFLRLLLIPAIIILLLIVTGLYKLNPDGEVIAMTNIIAYSCATGVVASLFPAMFGMDKEYGAGIVAFSTLVSIVTVPAVLAAARLAMRL